MNLMPPHGGKGLKPLQAFAETREDLLHYAIKLNKISISERSFGDLKMLANGGFTPLSGFMDRENWQTVCENFCLSDGTFWPMPILLDINKEDIPTHCNEVALTYSNQTVAIINITDSWHSTEKDLKFEAEFVYKGKGKDSQNEFLTRALKTHPGVIHIFSRKRYYLGGEITVLATPEQLGVDPDFELSPKQFRELASDNLWYNITCLQLRNPPHRSHEYLMRIGLEIHDALLIHTPIGILKKDDLPVSVRLACIKAILKNYLPEKRVIVAGYPLDMRYAGPREALLHATFRQNYGINTQIIGRDHAGIGDFYVPFEAQEIFNIIPINVDSSKNLLTRPLKIMWPFYCKKCDSMATLNTCPHSMKDRELHSGSLLRTYLAEKKAPPKGIVRKEVYNILSEYYNKTKHVAPQKLYGASSGETIPIN